MSNWNLIDPIDRISQDNIEMGLQELRKVNDSNHNAPQSHEVSHIHPLKRIAGVRYSSEYKEWRKTHI